MYKKFVIVTNISRTACKSVRDIRQVRERKWFQVDVIGGEGIYQSDNLGLDEVWIQKNTEGLDLLSDIMSPKGQKILQTKFQISLYFYYLAAQKNP